MRLDDLDLDIDDETMKQLFARQSVRPGAKAKAKAAPKKESVLDGKRLHLTSITLKSAKLNQDAALMALLELDRSSLPLGNVEVITTIH